MSYQNFEDRPMITAESDSRAKLAGSRESRKENVSPSKLIPLSIKSGSKYGSTSATPVRRSEPGVKVTFPKVEIKFSQAPESHSRVKSVATVSKKIERMINADNYLKYNKRTNSNYALKDISAGKPDKRRADIKELSGESTLIESATERKKQQYDEEESSSRMEWSVADQPPRVKKQYGSIGTSIDLNWSRRGVERKKKGAKTNPRCNNSEIRNQSSIGSSSAKYRTNPTSHVVESRQLLLCQIDRETETSDGIDFNKVGDIERVKSLENNSLAQDREGVAQMGTSPRQKDQINASGTSQSTLPNININSESSSIEPRTTREKKGDDISTSLVLSLEVENSPSCDSSRALNLVGSHHEESTSRKPPAAETTEQYLTFRRFLREAKIPNAKQAVSGHFFKFYTHDTKLIRYTLEDNGFKEVLSNSSNEWMIMWASSAIKPQVYKKIGRNQKVNHFPRSYEITRKDCLYRNIAKMQASFGPRHFGFCPKTFLLPQEQELLAEEMNKEKSSLWIVKPVDSSQGKGIQLISRMSELTLQAAASNLVVSRYIANPLLVNGFKSDIRLYVAITSIHPLKIYVYKDGLVRFATHKYAQEVAKKNDLYMHLTNYSINKHSESFVSNVNPEIDDYGSKWSILAFRRYLKQQGIDDDTLFKKIEDVIIKTIISIEPSIKSGVDMFVPHRRSCFELLGFDILVDQSLNPWLLEVNLSPSLNCDSPLDHRIKAAMIANFLDLGLIYSGKHILQEKKRRSRARRGLDAPLSKQGHLRTPKEFDVLNSPNLQRMICEDSENKLTREDLKVIGEYDQELSRAGAFKMIFPVEGSTSYLQFFAADRPWNTLLINQVLNPKTSGPSYGNAISFGSQGSTVKESHIYQLKSLNLYRQKLTRFSPAPSWPGNLKQREKAAKKCEEIEKVVIFEGKHDRKKKINSSIKLNRNNSMGANKERSNGTGFGAFVKKQSNRKLQDIIPL